MNIFKDNIDDNIKDNIWNNLKQNIEITTFGTGIFWFYDASLYTKSSNNIPFLIHFDRPFHE